MSSGSQPPAGGAEFEPVSGEQIYRIADLARQMVDGTFSLASKTHTFETELFKGEFFHHWIVQYSYATAGLEPVSDEQARKILDHPDRYFPGFPAYSELAGIENNAPGLLLGLPADVEPDSEALSIDASISENRSGVGYHLTPRYTDYSPDPHIDPCEVPETATEEQVRILSNMTGLIAPFCKLEPLAFAPTAVEDTAERLGEQMHTFQEILRLDLPRAEPSPSILGHFREQLQDLLGRRSAVVEFVRRYGDNSNGGSVKLTLGQSELNRPTVAYDIRTGTPASGSELFVTTLQLDDKGFVDYGEHFDVDIEKEIQHRLQDPNYSFTRDFFKLGAEVEQIRQDSREAFAEEKKQGFHEFSQADADRIIQALEEASR